jgi:2-polyprenyl-3-methyl-5-hydroxy-6-metoxy-1,4-benzoquinol methylase
MIAECSHCRLHSAYPVPTKEDLDRAYRGVPHHVNVEPDSFFGKIWRAFRDSGRLRLLRRYMDSGTVVDVGTGAGLFLKAARARGEWNLIGTDLSEVNVANLRKQFDVRKGTLDDVGLEEGSVNAIWASHVIEHMIDPFEFLSTARAFLKPGGYIFIFVPSETSIRARTGTSNWHLVNPPGHLWGFRPSTLRPILQRAGFDIRSIRNSLMINELICIARKPL